MSRPRLVLLALALLTAFGIGLWLSALNVQYRDVEHAIPFLIQAWMYASPVVFSIDKIPEGAWRTLYALNPMVGVIDGFRWCLLGSDTQVDLTRIGVSLLVAALLLVSGIWYFRRTERSFADSI